MSGLLVIDAGALVCGTASAELVVDSLIAEGLSDQPIVFAPVIEGEFWGGIRVRLAATLRHSRIESAVSAVAEAPLSSATITIEDSHIMRASSGMSSQYLVLRRVDVDSACHGTPNCAAVFARPYGSAHLEDVRIRDSGGSGVATSYRCSIYLSNVAIERSADVGIILPQQVGGGCAVSAQMPVSVTGGGSYPMQVDGWWVAALWLTGEGAGLLAGNARDTLLVNNPGSFTSPLTIRKELAVRLSDCIGYTNIYTRRLARVTVQAGATLSIEGGCTWLMDLEMEGNADDPATLIAPQTRIRSIQRADAAHIRHARIRGPVLIADSSAIVFENVQLADASLYLNAAGSRIEGLTASRSAERLTGWPYESVDPATLLLSAGTEARRLTLVDARGNALVITGDADLSECSIRGSGGHGVRVEAGRATVTDCNLVSNHGAGISSISAFEVQAPNNWWGDAAGPLGPAGDGVDGNIQFSPWRSEPLTHPGWSAYRGAHAFAAQALSARDH